MASLQNAQIDQTYQALLKTGDNGAITGTPKAITDGAGAATNLEMSNTATNFVSGTVDFTGATVSGLPTPPASDPFSPISLSGTAQTLDLSQYNFGNGGTLTGATTVAFSNIPTEKSFAYSYIVAPEPFKFDGLSYNDVFGVFGGLSPVDGSFKSDGSIIFMQRGETSGDSLKSFNLSTPWDITTAGAQQVSFDLQTQDNQMNGHTWKADGLTFWAVGAQFDAVYEYTLTTAWDLNTASYSGNSFSIATQATLARSIYFKPDGTSFYISDDLSNSVWQYNMSTAYDITTATVAGSISVNSQDSSVWGLLFANNGLSFTIAGNANDALFSYNLTTAWDITTASYSNNSFDLSTVASGDWQGLFAGEDGETMIAVYRDTERIFEFDFGSAAVTFPSSVQNPVTTTFASGDVVTQSFYTLDGGTNIYVEEIPTAASGGGAAAGLVNGAGASSLIAASSLLTDPAAANGDKAIALGSGSNAQGANNISLGADNLTGGIDVINIGDNNNMSQYNDRSVLVRPGGGTGIAFRGDSVCIGEDTYPGAGGVQIGKGAFGKNNNPNVAIGKNSEAGDTSVAIGENADAKGNGGVAIGANAIADGSGSDGRVAIGKGADAGNNKAIAIGVNNPSCQSEGIAIGDGVSISTSDRSIAIGNAITLNTGNDKIAIGTAASVAGQRGLAFGQNASATANEAIAMGYNVTAAKAQTLAVNELETKLVGGGITMVSPNGTEYKLTVSDAGALVIT